MGDTTFLSRGEGRLLVNEIYVLVLSKNFSNKFRDSIKFFY